MEVNYGLESQKGIHAVQQCSVENQKGTVAIDVVVCTAVVPFWFST